MVAPASPRALWLRIGIAAACFTALLAIVRLPYDAIAARIEYEVAKHTGWQVTLDALAFDLSLLGPGVSAGPVEVSRPGSPGLRLERLRLRPALSLSWLRLAPAFRVVLESPEGSADGILTFSTPPAFEGDLLDVDLQAWVPERGPGSPSLSGRLDAAVNLSLDAFDSLGSVSLVAREGALSHPLLPIGIPFERFDIEAELGSDPWITIHIGTIASPLLSGSLQGTLGRPPGGPVDLNLDLQPSAAAVATLRSVGLRPGADGRLPLRIIGTAARPQLR